MVKLLGVTFAALLVCAHFADVRGDAYQRPLSMFRDFEPAWIGYTLFCVLVAIGCETIRTAFRVGAVHHTVVYFAATVLLAVVAATPSQDELHNMCALMAMAVVFIYYAVLLYQSDSYFWLLMHLLLPSFLMMASQLESYGVWQKGMILYFLMAAIVHQHLLAEGLPRGRNKRQKKLRIQIGRRAT